MVEASWSIITTEFMRENGSLISNMEKVMKNSQMGRNTKANMLMGSQKESERTSGPTANSTKANGSTDSNMVLECGEGLEEIRTSVSGNLGRLMVMVSIRGSMVIDTRANSRVA